MKKALLFFTVVSLLACGSSRKVADEDKFIIENLTGYTAEEVSEKYPDANIREDKGLFEEGTVERAYSILYPDTPNELHITWADEAKTRIYDIRFSERGDWKSAEGIRIGTTYKELNEINEKEISFYGFGWDYGGAVMWNDGKLENSDLRVFLAPGNGVKDEFYGDRIIEATPEEIEEMDLRVETIMLMN